MQALQWLGCMYGVFQGLLQEVKLSFIAHAHSHDHKHRLVPAVMCDFPHGKLQLSMRCGLLCLCTMQSFVIYALS